MSCANCGSGSVKFDAILPTDGMAVVMDATCLDCGAPSGLLSITPTPQFDIGAATDDELQRLKLYGACPMCRTPRDWRQHEDGETIGLELVQPCGHPMHL